MSTDQKSAVTSSATKEVPVQEQAPATTTTAAPTANTEAPVTPATTDVATKEEEDVHKVFVGNLSFQTKEEGLVAFFETSGKVLEAKIITIRPHYRKRSAGYGFVTFATLEDTIKAAKELNKKELDGREVNVEVARPKPIVPKPTASSTDDVVNSETEAAPKQQKRRARKNKNKTSEETLKEEIEPAQDDAAATTKQPKAVKTKAVKNAKKSKDTAAAVSTTDEEQTTQSDDTASIASDASSSRGARRPRQKKNKKAKKAAANAERRRVKKELTEPSQTTLFVANIPYSSTDETLKEVFKNFKVASAHVARMRNGRSKGYGFVDMESQAEQLKALETVKDVELEGRTIYLKVALSERPQETVVDDEEKKADAVPAAAPAVAEKAKEPVKENGTVPAAAATAPAAPAALPRRKNLWLRRKNL
ncbi:hypothetical protein BCR42DRAFT_385148 [Absidia repens]|uniref:RRM domain-containing protein n=1 Tax=Absidia repens TaxID=90262 RepID=A0A1X2HX63_9FUNG|nr:hypothetical protein BCR42DRAFT_385148 [Absidia repens]